MVWETRTNNTYHVSTLYDGDLTHVDVYHLPTGLRASGNSRRYAEDTYNQIIGRDLAYYRAFERLSHKISRHLVRHLPVTGI
jgi:hypothetical protein